MAELDPLHAMPVAEITIKYSLGDNGDSNHTVEHTGEDNLVTLLGMLEMAKDTMLEPGYFYEADHG